jgi:hypothetical protein
MEVRIPDESVDLVFADPPFNLGKLYDLDEGTLGQNATYAAKIGREIIMMICVFMGYPFSAPKNVAGVVCPRIAHCANTNLKARDPSVILNLKTFQASWSKINESKQIASKLFSPKSNGIFRRSRRIAMQARDGSRDIR